MKPPDRSPGLVPDRLRCEYLADPLGIDAARPRLSWIVRVRGARAGADRLPGAGGVVGGTTGRG